MNFVYVLYTTGWDAAAVVVVVASVHNALIHTISKSEMNKKKKTTKYTE